jgi:cellulose synthase/poly-beta-1,6-N-acetylglucosamine synthase-like glycosyltransferase
VAAVKAVLDDDRFELVQVPDALPRTKPKALNYALPMARGAHIVVYDAEDIPNRDQLRLAAGAFAANVGVDCLQAELLIDNARENTLTALFAGEYAGQFGVMLAALARWGLPMPLGGTSNHFRTTSLREMGGWDAFNVTEDADLGVRLARLRYTTDMLPSQTGEEAPISITAWMRQRTRWMKGWMQTFIVHNRHPHALLRDLGWKGFAAFEIYVGSMILSPVLHTVFLTSMLVRFLAGRPPLSPSMLETGLLVLLVIFGYGGSFALVAAGLLRLGQKRLLAAQLLLPFYWVLHSIATARAAVELLTRPHFWAKTTHGLTRLERSFETDRRAPLSLLRKSHLEQPDTAAPTAPHDSGISLEML